jgi:hypothetical protein
MSEAKSECSASPVPHRASFHAGYGNRNPDGARAKSGVAFAMCRIVAIVLLLAASAALAGPVVPPSDLPGRERYRFTPSPLDRFMQPTPQVEPRIRWDCDDRSKRRRAKRGKEC